MVWNVSERCTLSCFFLFYSNKSKGLIGIFVYSVTFIYWYDYLFSLINTSIEISTQKIIMFKQKNDIKNINAQVLIKSFNYSTYYFVRANLHFCERDNFNEHNFKTRTYVDWFFNIKFQF